MPNNTPRVAILLLGYNDKENLADAITSVEKQTYPEFDIVYLDNGSSDGSADFVKKKFPNVKIIQEKNLGYSGTYAKYLPSFFAQDYVAAILLNTDVVVAENWLANLVLTAFEDSQIASAQPKIYLWENGQTDRINSFGNPVNFLGLGYCGQAGQKDRGQLDQKTDLFYASGCCLLIKKTAFETIGNLDADFFMYLEDQDWGARARLLGMKNILCPQSKMWHKYQFQKNPQNKQKFFYLERNRLFFIFKNYSFKLWLLILPAFLILEIGIILHSIKNRYLKEKLLAYWAFFRSLPALFPKRRKLQTEKILSDKEFFARLSPALEIENFGGQALKIANWFFRWYYNLIKKVL